ncbi:MAG TPA: DUF3795 domain-containing protein [Oscillospiraceae bacterium]|nr:DUF3795 domain-containing protein [Oscillospiraceae bacterium]
MIESRCGILCGECEYRESMGCKGCVNIEKPFWGDACPVKSCCEGKGLENCGMCEVFPCELLNSFAYDKEQGDDGKRILQCRKWCGKDN